MADKPETKVATIATMSRRIDYDDGSGPRCEVSYDSAFRLGKDPERFVRIKAIGDEILVYLGDIPFLKDALDEALRLDEQVSS